jgi:ATP-dependent RNA helicase DDX35
LRLKALGIDNLANFEYLPPAPPSGMMVRGLEFLSAIDALDEWGRLTPVGEKMAELPVEPMTAKCLLASQDFRCTAEMVSIAAMTSVASPFIIPDEGRSRAGAEGELERRKFTAEEGDALTLLNVFNTFVNPRVGRQSARWCTKHRLNFKALSRAVSIRSQLARYLERFGINTAISCEGDAKRLRKCLTSGYFRNAARKTSNGEWRSVRDDTLLHVHPSSVLFSRELPVSTWVIFSEVVLTTKAFMRDVTVIERVSRCAVVVATTTSDNPSPSPVQDWLPELA